MTFKEAQKLMPPCPICGKKAYLSKCGFDGYFFGYDGGCPSFRLNDGVHGISESSDTKAPYVTAITPEKVVEDWRIYCEKMKAGDDMSYRLSPRQRRASLELVMN